MSASSRAALGAALLLAVLGGCNKPRQDLFFWVDADVDLETLSRVEVLVEGVDGAFDVMMPEMSVSPLGVQLVGDVAADTMIVLLDFEYDPTLRTRINGLLVQLKTPGGHPRIRMTATVTALAGLPLAVIPVVEPAEVEFARDGVSVRLTSGMPLDAGATDADISDAAGSDAAPEDSGDAG